MIVIYLDNTATIYPKPECVYQAADEFYRKYGGNAGRGYGPLAKKGAKLMEETRAITAEWLGVSSAEKVAFTHSATIALNTAIQGSLLQSGDTVYVSPFEHNAVLRPVEHLRQTIGIKIREIPFEKNTYSCQIEQLKEMFHSDQPKLICVTQSSNVCGVMPPVVEIAKAAKSFNSEAIVIVDGAQSAGLFPLPLNSGLIDALIFAGHKSMYGPFGAAGLVLLSKWKPAPLIYGGTGTHSESVSMPDEMPTLYEAGSPNVWSIAGLKASIEWLKKKSREKIISDSMKYIYFLRDELKKIPEVKIYAPSEETPWWNTLSFTVNGFTPQFLEFALGSRDIAVRSGIHCAPNAHRFIGTLCSNGTVRVSTSSFSSAYDVESCMEVLKRTIYT